MYQFNSLLTPFQSQMKTKIIFGDDTINELGSLCDKLGQSAILVSGKSSMENGRVDLIKKNLKKYNISLCVFNRVTSDPTVHHVNKIINLCKINNVDMMISIGGGSVIDATKAAGMIFKNGGKTEDYIKGIVKVGNESLPHIAIPTTSGTGSELSKGAIISWPEKNIKTGIRGNSILPTIAIVDPLLTLSLPIDQIKITGFDCFSHAVETYISKLANPLTAIYSATAINSVVKYLPIAISDPENIEARNQLSFNSMMMGYNLANSSTCLPHRLQYPLGALTKTPHAFGLAALYPSWISITASFSQKKFNNVSRWLSKGLSLNDNSSFETLPYLLDEFLDRIKLRISKDQLSFSDKEAAKMAESVSGNLELDPWWNQNKDLKQFYEKYIID